MFFLKDQRQLGIREFMEVSLAANTGELTGSVTPASAVWSAG